MDSRDYSSHSNEYHHTDPNGSSFDADLDPDRNYYTVTPDADTSYNYSRREKRFDADAAPVTEYGSEQARDSGNDTKRDAASDGDANPNP